MRSEANVTCEEPGCDQPVIRSIIWSGGGDKGQMGYLCENHLHPYIRLGKLNGLKMRDGPADFDPD